MSFEWVKIRLSRDEEPRLYLLVKPNNMSIHVMGNIKVTVSAVIEGMVDSRNCDVKYQFEFWLNVSAIKWNGPLKDRDQ